MKKQNNKTKKNKKCSETDYTEFEKEYSKSLPKKNLRLSNKKNIQVFIKKLELKEKPKVLPQNDFYTYINYTWLEDRSFDTVKLKKEQKYITQIDNFRLVQDKVADQLTEVIKDFIKNNNSDESKRLNNFFISGIKRNSIQSSKKYIKNIINTIDELRKDKNNFWKMLAYVNKYSFCKDHAPFYIDINHNYKNSNKFMAYLNPHILSISDNSIYVDDSTNTKYKDDYRNAFINYCNKLFMVSLGKNHNLDPKFPLEMGKKFYKFLYIDTDENIIEDPLGYNIISADDALNKYKFNWNEFCRELGYKKVPTHFCCTNLNFLKFCTEYFIENWNSEELKSYWYYIIIRMICRFTKDWVNIFYDFYGKYSKGQQSFNPIYYSNMIFGSFAFNKLLSKLYIDKFYDEKSVSFVKGLSEDLREVFIRVLKRNNWLDKSTKENAIKKLRDLKFILVGSDNIIDDPIIDYKQDDFLGNMLKISDWNTNNIIKLTNDNFIDLPLINWVPFPAGLVGKQSYVVNAYYIPQQNSMFIPLGYMQKPFVDLDNRGIEYNLSQIGFTIAHELSHSLDSLGSQFDYKGNYNNWWTNKDKMIYQKIQQNIIKQYKEWTERDGLKYDPSIGIEEDIADISGLALCEEYLRDYQLNNKTILLVRQISFDAFYVYFAYQNRQKISKRALVAELKLNPHPLVKYRTNIPLSRSDIFNIIYDVKKNDKMYWPDKSTIW